MAPSSDATAQGFVAPPPPEVEAELSLSVDAVDVSHGSLRVQASMVEGSADVSMWLGPTCETREVGRGFATRSGFSWSLTREEVARAIECNLIVRARGVDEEGQRVRWTATLPVSVGLVADGGDEETRLMRQESDGKSTKLVFAGPSRADRVHIAGTTIGREDAEVDEKAPKGLYLSAFVIDNHDLALSTVSRRHLSLLGDRYLATVSVGSVTLDVSLPEPPAEPEPEAQISNDEEPPPRLVFHRGYYARSGDDCEPGDCQVDYDY